MTKELHGKAACMMQEALDRGCFENVPVYAEAVDAINRKVIGQFSNARTTGSGVMATFTPNCEGKRFLRALGRKWRGLDGWRRKAIRFKARALYNKLVALGSGPVPFDMLNPPELSGKALRDAINEVRP